MKQVKRNKIFLFFLLLALGISACTSNEVDENRIAKIYVELEIARIKNFENKESLEKARLEIFAKYKMDHTEFIAAMDDFEYDEEKWKDFFDNAQAYVDTLINMQAATDEESIPGKN